MILSNILHKKAFSAALFFYILIFGANCGKRAPPLPPVEKVSQRIEISGFQRGGRVNLSWTMPARNPVSSSVSNISRADIYRLAEPIDAPRTLSEEEFSSQSTLIGTLSLKADDFGLKKINYNDELQFAGQNARLRYAVRFVNSAGQKAAFSNFLLIEPTAKTAQPPENLQAEGRQSEVYLSWTAPNANVDDSKPANILGYNIYRSESESRSASLLNKTPVNQNFYSDRTFNFDTKYFYFVRAVSLGTGGEPVESLETNIINVIPKDVYPPTEPTAVTIAAAPQNISIFFAANPEKDIAGYRIFRSTDKNLPLNEWRSINVDLLITNTFQDTDVEPGKTYYYYLVAIDKTGNVSRPSAVVSETSP